MELPIELAQLGLKGTLIGAVAGGALILALALIAAFSERAQITGTHLCIIMGLVAATVAAYGGYVFGRSLTLTGDLEGKRISLGIAAMESRPKTAGE
jgi:hypothetical protein